MAEFNKVFVNCVADESLYGKYGYFADSLSGLIHCVTNGALQYWCRLSESLSENESFPFVNEEDGLHYRYFYYDPTLCRGVSVSFDRVATYRELSKWLAQGNGEGIYNTFSTSPHLTFTELRYEPVDGNLPVQDIMVRKWDSTEWSVPSATYLGLKSKRED